MPESNAPAVGQIGWIDLTVPDAERVRAFWLIYITVADLDESVRRYAARLYQPE